MRFLPRLIFLCSLLASRPWAHGEDAPAAFGPLPNSPHAITWREHAATNRAWAERVLLKPFRTRIAQQPWREEASRFADEAVDGLIFLRHVEPLEKILTEGRKLKEAGCRDPLFLYFMGQAEYTLWPYGRVGQDDLKAAEEGAAKLPENAGLLWCLERDLSVAVGLSEPAAAPHLEKVAKLLETVWTDGTYGPEDDVLFYDQFLSRSAAMVSTKTELLRPVLLRLKTTPWLQKMMLAHLESERGNQEGESARPAGFPNPHYRESSRLYQEAWQLKSDRPEAAVGMIYLAPTFEECRTWFDRATALQFDQSQCYLKLLDWLNDQPGPQVTDLIIAFGKACLATQRYDTDVPMYFSAAMRMAAHRVDDWKTIYRRPDLARQQLALSQAIVDEPTRQDNRRSNLEFLGINAFLCGDFKLAAKLRRELPDFWSSDAMDKLREFGIDDFDAALAAAQHQYGGELTRAEGGRVPGTNDGSQAALSELIVRDTPRAIAFLNPELMRANFARKFEAGEWIASTSDYEDPTWQGGPLNKRRPPTATPLTDEEKRQRWHAVHTYALPGDFEMRAELPAHAAPPDTLIATLFAAERPPSNIRHYLDATEIMRIEVRAQAGGQLTAQIKRNAKEPVTPAISFRGLDVNTVSFQIHSGKISLEINGTILAKDVDLPPGHRMPNSDTVVGFDRPPQAAEAPTKIELHKVQPTELPGAV